jgi:filamentous hemagglutinin
VDRGGKGALMGKLLVKILEKLMRRPPKPPAPKSPPQQPPKVPEKPKGSKDKADKGGDAAKKRKECVGICKNSPETQKSVDEKLEKYLLNKDHPVGKDKAEWFDKALGYNKSNMDDLSKQIQFDPSKAIPTQLTEYGQKFNQIIPITGANGRIIDVNFAWIRNNDGIVRLVTGVPVK